MTDNSLTPPPAAPNASDLSALAKSDPQIMSGARWFWWIAGLSLVNTILLHSGSDTNFVIGLGFTILSDSVFSELKAVAFAIDAIALATFFGFGWFAAKGRQWAFIAGIVLYAIDALIYVPFEAWMSVGFHVFALIFIVRGLLSLRAAIKAVSAADTLPPVVPPAAG